MSKTQGGITRDEAAQILQSAVSYCQKAGIMVTGYNDSGTLVLAFEGVMLVQAAGTMEFVPLLAEGKP